MARKHCKNGLRRDGKCRKTKCKRGRTKAGLCRKSPRRGRRRR